MNEICNYNNNNKLVNTNEIETKIERYLLEAMNNDLQNIDKLEEYLNFNLPMNNIKIYYKSYNETKFKEFIHMYDTIKGTPKTYKKTFDLMCSIIYGAHELEQSRR